MLDRAGGEPSRSRARTFAAVIALAGAAVGTASILALFASLLPAGLRLLADGLVVGIAVAVALRRGLAAWIAVGVGVGVGVGSVAAASGGALPGWSTAVITGGVVGAAAYGVRLLRCDRLGSVTDLLRYVAVALVTASVATVAAWGLAQGAGAPRAAAGAAAASTMLGLTCFAPVALAVRARGATFAREGALAAACTAYSIVMTTWVFAFVDPADPGPFGWPFVAAAGALVAAATLGLPVAAWQTAIVAVGSITATAYGRGRYVLDVPTASEQVMAAAGFACFVGLLVLTLAVLRDERVRLTRSAEQSTQVLAAVVDATPAVVFAKEYAAGAQGPGRYILVNAAWRSAFDRPLSSVLGRTDAEMFDPPDASRHTDEDAQVLAGRAQLTVDEVGVGSSEQGRLYRTEKFPLRDGAGRAWGVGGVAIDVTAIRDAQLREQRQVALLRAVFELSPTPAVLVGRGAGGELVVSAANAAMGVLLGDESACAGEFGECVVAEDRATVLDLLEVLATGAAESIRPREVRIRRRDESVRWVRLSAAAVPDAEGNPAEVVVQFEDFTATREAERALSVQALRDPVTGLPNRDALHERLGTALARLARRPGLVVALFCDLDHFKDVNDSQGHRAGDALLVEVAEQLKSAVRRDDVVARIGGDEFVVVTEGLADATDAVAFAMRLQDRLRAVGRSDRPGADLTMSVGIATATDHALTAEEVMRRADLAMYRAKESGRNRVEVYDTDAEDALRRALAVQQELRGAIDAGRFETHHQPIVRLADSSIARTEALVRMRAADGRLWMPDTFIAEAETSGLIVPMGRIVARQALSDLVVLRRRIADVGVAINLSPVQLRDEGFSQFLLDAIEAAGVRPEWVGVEVTETALLRDPGRAQAELQALRAAGVRIALDDFGTGYSSLTWLTQFPVDVVKIDRSFTAALGVDPRRSALVRALVSVAHELGLTTVAEGIETTGQRDVLADYGCEFGQGYLFGRPTPLDDDMWSQSARVAR